MNSGEVDQRSAPPDQPRWVDVADVHTAYRRGGSGDPLLYLHGSGLTKRWLPIHSALAAHFDVVAPEHPGYGDTVRPRWYREIDDMVLHYADLLDALGLQRVHLVGHSIGGRIAGAFAGIFPHRLLSLTLVTPAPLDPGGAVEPPPWSGDMEDSADALLFNGNQRHYPQFCNGDDEGLLVAADDGDVHADPQGWSIDAAPALYRRLGRIECPSTVIFPDQDMLIPHHYFQQWVDHLPGAKAVHVRGVEHPTGHLLIVQEPHAIADVVASHKQRPISDGVSAINTTSMTT